MTPEERVKKILTSEKGYKIRDDYPEEVQVAVKTFLEATKMVLTEELDSIPIEYLEKMMITLMKYPETHKVAGELLQIMKDDGVL
tara:strand:- start:425 stop:679 length:255 start_codon:yes stop_codon:yes gene_type:complete